MLSPPASVLTFIALALLGVGLGAHLATAAETRPACGATPQQAIAEAEKALHEKHDAKNQALACLIEAVRQLVAEQPVVLRGDDRHPMLHVPVGPGGPGKP